MNYFPVRTGIVIGQLRSAGMFPSFDAPVFNINGSPKYGGQVNAGDLLTMTASTGTIYYTLDGSDPRLPGGAVNPNAHVFQRLQPADYTDCRKCRKEGVCPYK